MKTILVPTDFSPNANKALDFAVGIAKPASAKIIIIHACDLLDITFKDQVKIEQEYNQKIIDESAAKLKLLEESIEEAEQLVVETQIYKGLVMDTILLAASEHKPDLVIMGTLGNSGLKEKIYGSKTSGVIGKINVPVLAIPLLSEWTKPSTILLAVNHFDQDIAVTEPLFDLAGLFNARVRVVLFTDKLSPDYSLQEQDLLNYEAKLNSRYKNISVYAKHLEGYKFAETIENYISEEDIDILAMMTHKRNFLESLFNRSLTRKMSYHIRVPLLALPKN
ncbi:MAG: universal stress protein [Chitinophagaceae bacterium]